MPSSLTMTLLITITSLTLTLTTAATAETTNITTTTYTAYEILQSYDFPVGLLPKGATGYELNRETGEFKLFLPKTCRFHIDSYELEYKKTISGRITKDRLYNLKGVSVKVVILWLNIVEVRKEEDELQFSVGIASANFPLDGFEESPQCGCGFDCLGLDNNLVSSS